MTRTRTEKQFSPKDSREYECVFNHLWFGEKDGQRAKLDECKRACQRVSYVFFFIYLLQSHSVCKKRRRQKGTLLSFLAMH